MFYPTEAEVTGTRGKLGASKRVKPIFIIKQQPNRSYGRGILPLMGMETATSGKMRTRTKMKRKMQMSVKTPQAKKDIGRICTRHSMVRLWLQ